MSGDIDAKRADRADLAREVIAIFDAAVNAVTGNRAVWLEEAARLGAPPLLWPPRLIGRGGYPQLMLLLIEATVDNILLAMKETGRVPPPMAADHPEFQWVLRVVERATQAADVALRARFGGSGRLPLKRELLKLLKERDALAALADRQSRPAAFRAAGMSKSAAYRALNRARARKK